MVMKKVFAVILLFAIDYVFLDDEKHDKSLLYEFNWYPIYYSINFSSTIAISKYNKKFTGSVRIEGIATRKAQELFLHSKVQIVKGYLLKESRDIEIEKISLNKTNDMLKLELKSPLFKNDMFNLTLFYHNNLSDHSGPIYVIHSTDVFTRQYRPIISTEFQPIGARALFPCIDLPRFKVNFDISVLKPPIMTALSNMPSLVISEQQSNMLNQVWESFTPSTVKMPTYTMSVVLFGIDYKNVTIDSKNTVWYSTLNNKTLNYKLDFIKTAVENMELVTGVKYMLPKLDHVIIVNKEFSGMESWGLITYSEQDFKEKGLMTWNEEINLLDLVIHEIVHQWFGNLITCKYWCYVWLNECVTSYVTILLLSHMYPNLSFQELYLVSRISNVMNYELKTPQVLQNLDSCNEMLNNRWDLAMEHYFKGAAILHMVVNNIMTVKMFKDGLKKYTQDNMYGSVIDHHFWRAMESQFDETTKKLVPDRETLTSLMRPWFENEGYPIVIISRSKEGLISASQIPILDGIEECTWWIPLTYTTIKEKKFNDLRLKYWLTPNNKSQYIDVILNDNEWIIFNLQNTGYYRVVYDDLSYSILIKHLMFKTLDDIHPINRAQLVEESFELSFDGWLHFSIPLKLLKYLKRERHYLPLDRGMNQLEKIAMFCSGTSVYTKLKNYMRYLIIDAYHYIKSPKFKKYKPANYLFSSRIVQLACKLEIKHCIDQAKMGAEMIVNEKWIEYGVVPELRITMWCTAVKFGNATILNYLMIQLRVSEISPTITDAYAHAVLCASNNETLFGVLTYIFKKSNLGFDDIDFLASQFAPADNNCTLIDFLKRNYKIVVQKYGEKIVKKIIISVAYEIIEPQCIKKVQELADSKQIYISTRTASQSMLLCHLTDEWLKKENVQFVDTTSNLSEGIILENVFYKEGNTFFELSLKSII